MYVCSCDILAKFLFYNFVEFCHVLQLQSKHVNSEFENQSDGPWTSAEDDRHATMSHLYGTIASEFCNCYCLCKTTYIL